DSTQLSAGERHSKDPAMPARHALQLSAALLLTSCFLFGSAARVSAQVPADVAPPVEGFLILVPVREMHDVDAAIDAADGDLARAQRAEHLAANLRIDTRADIERMKQALVAVKRRRATAKDA